MAHAPKPQNAVPSVALLLAWAVPGAGHLYLGRLGTAAAAFAAVVGLFASGLALSDGRAFELLDAELRSPLALALTPEVGCLGALLYQFSQHGFGLGPPQGFPVPLPSGIHLGVALSALAGLLNLAFCVDAHLGARIPPRAGVAAPAALVAAGWAIPGLGHWLQGRRARALWVALLVLGLFAYGTFLAEGSNLSRSRHFYYWAAQVLGGLPVLVTEFAAGHGPYTRAIPQGDVGLLFAALAGLFNLVLLIDVYGWQEAVLEGRDPRAKDLGAGGGEGEAAPGVSPLAGPVGAASTAPEPAPTAPPPPTPPIGAPHWDNPLAPPRP